MKFWNFRNSYRISLLAACHSVVCVSSQYVDSKDLDSENFSTWEDLELDDHWKKTNIAENSSPLAHKPLFSHTKIKIYTNYLTNWALSHTALATSYRLERNWDSENISSRTEDLYLPDEYLCKPQLSSAAELVHGKENHFCSVTTQAVLQNIDLSSRISCKSKFVIWCCCQRQDGPWD